MENIVWLSDISRESINVAGGKGANLAEMYNSKMPVPSAFIVTAQAYKEFIEESGLKDKINYLLLQIRRENTAELEAKAKEIQKIITDAEMPEELKEEIIENYNHLSVDKEVEKITKAQEALNILKAGHEQVFVAVRSSATTEDLETASFAGQQETFLNIKGSDALINAIKHCWASLFTDRAIYYREEKNFAHEKSFIAVIVQKMVNSDKAGVIFTVNPLNNADEIIIEASFGLGEGIVSGAVSPDYYVIDKKNLKIKTIKKSNKKIYFTRNSSGETVKLDVPASRVNEQALDTREIKKLANYAVEIENHYNHAQDIEFGIEGNRVYILQTRPITTLKQETKASVAAEIKASLLVEGLAASPGVASGPVKIIKNLDDLPKIQKGDILVTEMTNPSMVVSMQKSTAIVTDEGGQTAHAAIVSREMGIPCVVGTETATSLLKENQIITVDGNTGKIYEGTVAIQTALEKPKEKLELPETEGEEKEKVEEIEKTEETKEVKKPSKTKIYMNLGEPEKIMQYKDLQFDGIGLMRLEFVIASEIGEHPLHLIEIGQQQRYIDSLVKGIKLVAETIAPKPIIVRFSDFKTNEYHDLKGGDKYEQLESNPMIGFRGVSRYISEEFKEAFKLECNAIKKVCEECNNVWIMLPFVREKEEVEKCLEIMKSEGLERNENFKILLMAEVPSMAIMPEEFAKLPIDGVSIGSNDLTQLVLGVDRDSTILGKLGYFDERNPAVLQAIVNIIKGFHEHNKTVSICGQAPSVYAEIVEFLVKYSIDSISVNPDAVNAVRSAVAQVEGAKEAEEKQEKEIEKEEIPEDPEQHQLGIQEENEKF